MPQNEAFEEAELESEQESEIEEADNQSDNEVISVGDIKSDLTDISDKIIALEKLLLLQDNEKDIGFVKERIENLRSLLSVLEIA